MKNLDHDLSTYRLTRRLLSLKKKGFAQAQLAYFLMGLLSIGIPKKRNAVRVGAPTWIQLSISVVLLALAIPLVGLLLGQMQPVFVAASLVEAGLLCKIVLGALTVWRYAVGRTYLVYLESLEPTNFAVASRGPAQTLSN